MRDDLFYVDDLAEAAGLLVEFVHGKSFEDFAGDKMLRSAVLYELVVIGEAAARISRAFRAAHPEIPWRQLSTVPTVRCTGKRTLLHLQPSAAPRFPILWPTPIRSIGSGNSPPHLNYS
jgi:Protein of unknown function DUF86